MDPSAEINLAFKRKHWHSDSGAKKLSQMKKIKQSLIDTTFPSEIVSMPESSFNTGFHFNDKCYFSWDIVLLKTAEYASLSNSVFTC